MTLQEFLADQKKSASAFAAELGVSHTTVLRWVAGTLFPSRPNLELISAKTGGRVTPNDFPLTRDAA